jgi:pSer/pThr/pTyr-binding forkhead associated (FHA) protein
VYCTECGHHNSEGARFCGRCGASLIEADPGEPTEAFATVNSDPVDPVDTGDAVLVIRLGGGRSGDQFAIDRSPMTIGRAPQSDVFLDDITVSRDHALLERGANGLEITDRGSLNGTYVNRQRIETAQLADGDELQIGKYRLAYIDRGGG